MTAEAPKQERPLTRKEIKNMATFHYTQRIMSDTRIPRHVRRDKRMILLLGEAFECGWELCETKQMMQQKEQEQPQSPIITE